MLKVESELVSTERPMAVDQCHGATMVEWHGGFFANCHRQFVKGGSPWRHHKAQWRVYMAEFQPSTIFRHLPLITQL